jgi:hypothetical protein
VGKNGRIWRGKFVVTVLPGRYLSDAASFCDVRTAWPARMWLTSSASTNTQCLDLALLIDAEDKGSVGRGKVKADDIAYLVDQQRIVRQLERLDSIASSRSCR